MVLTQGFTSRCFAFGLVFTITFAVCAPAAAAEDVESVFKRGTELRRLGRDADALVEFQRASRLQDSPRASAQIALAEQALGLWLDANTHLMKALERPGDPWIQKNKTALDSALETIQARLCEIEVWGGPSGAEVFVDGRRAGTLPKVSTWLIPGSVPFHVKADGFSPVLRTLTAPEGGRIREHIDLRPLPAQQAKTVRVVPPPPADGPDSIPIITISPPAPATETSDSPIYRKWWFWTLIGAGVVVAGGTTAWIVTHDGNDGATCAAPCTIWMNK